MNCLRCVKVEMEICTRGKGESALELDICPGCGGIWLDASELAKLDDNFFIDVEQLELKDVSPTAGDAQLSCPRCEGVALRKVSPKIHQSVVLDKCPSCKGFWLDSGELEKVKDISSRALAAALFD